MAKKKAERGTRSQAIRDYLAEHSDASTTEIVTALKEKGVDVTANLVGNIRFQMTKKKVRRSAKVGTNEALAAQPALVTRGSRSQAIRDYLAQNPSANPKQIVAGLAEKGIEVKLGLASLIKYKKAPGQERWQPRRAAWTGGTIHPSAGGSISAGDIIEAKKLADALGGIENAKRALELLEQLR